jgi:uncharacterized protein (TIGR02284 family)
LSHAADEQAHPSTGTSDAAAPATGGNTDSNAGGVNALLTKAQDWVKDANLSAVLPRVTEPMQRFGSQAASQWSRWSTTQKVLGSAVLLGTGYFLLLRPGSKRRGSSHAAPLHELLLFVNDRVEGYKRAASESQDADLRNYYQQLASQSQQFSRRLNGYLREQDGGQEKGTTIKGKLYRAWMETKAAITGYDETAVLGSNVYGEEWAIKAYTEALQDRRLTGALRREVQRQYEQSQQTYRRLQQLQAQY